MKFGFAVRPMLFHKEWSTNRHQHFILSWEYAVILETQACDNGTFRLMSISKKFDYTAKTKRVTIEFYCAKTCQGYARVAKKLKKLPATVHNTTI